MIKNDLGFSTLIVSSCKFLLRKLNIENAYFYQGISKLYFLFLQKESNHLKKVCVKRN